MDAYHSSVRPGAPFFLRRRRTLSQSVWITIEFATDPTSFSRLLLRSWSSRIFCCSSIIQRSEHRTAVRMILGLSSRLPIFGVGGRGLSWYVFSERSMISSWARVCDVYKDVIYEHRDVNPSLPKRVWYWWSQTNWSNLDRDVDLCSNSEVG